MITQQSAWIIYTVNTSITWLQTASSEISEYLPFTTRQCYQLLSF